ncbi:olfactory receptor 5A2-like [Pleurodeles waltl]|uniref:olfactory receptor 5A2-like n=1 Tax=Pleurodeles waltl TaxID=8319 RepID=UPI0037094E37
MKPGNQSTVTKFILLGLTSDPGLQVLLFLLFLAVYVFTLVGNSLIPVIVWGSPHLHTPMYFFITQLSFLDLAFSTSISPKMLVDLLTEKKTISFYGCITQIYFFSACASTEFFLLAVMAFDRYVAICNPLLYTLTMNKCLCVRLVIGSFISGFLHSLIHATLFYRLYFCGPDIINHFVCDIPVLLKLSCTDISINDLVRFVCSAIVVATSLVVIFVSYFYIVATILRIGRAGRRRAASTCISHFTCTFLFYGSGFLMEMRPHSSSSEEQNKFIAVIPSLVVPALNPLIYSLRNNEVKKALKKLLYQPFYF